MIARSVLFKGHLCFSEEWAGLQSIKPINIIIGRNNTGKSHFLALPKSLCGSRFENNGWEYKCTGIMDEISLRSVFRENVSGGDLGGDHWKNHGRSYIGLPLEWTINKSGQTTVSHVKHAYRDDQHKSVHSAYLARMAQNATPPFSDHAFCRLAAERDIVPERESPEVILEENGRGATNIIRRFLLSSSLEFRRSAITEDILFALNSICLNNPRFKEIAVKQHDDTTDQSLLGTWEIYLDEEKKGLIPLSACGSGLKTIILTLICLLIIPNISGKKKKYVFAFEELENNLHPFLLRRLLEYIQSQTANTDATLFLTTHSSVVLDFFSFSERAQVIHVAKHETASATRTVDTHFDRMSIVYDLGSRPSDLMQANGVIWVEGPSDRIYINKWIDLVTSGQRKEGRDYQIAFYGGSLLARDSFLPIDKEIRDFSNLLRVNPNVIVVCDSDKKKKAASLKERVCRVKKEVEDIPRSHIWVTGCKEIENYVPGQVLSLVMGRDNLPNPQQYESMFSTVGQEDKSYFERECERRDPDKVQLAIECCNHISLDHMTQRFDWKKQMSAITETIRRWNE